ncbi:adenylate/guanylate cyclase domain-containing protein [Terricaulis sp.]|uniref:adenylate/guanylate cyclase domain-containing protein n=1 Tax=Terricaulis sp. TaxID=2768686 RepID=UPI00378486CF
MTTKLATIVAIDVAGFSAMTEANEDAAIAAVGRLGKRATECARRHGGRVFNTAGDSVMMEFQSVAHALEAAAELAANPDPPIRVGVHLGEVAEKDDGDLLGHGVNVAARLQQLAKPGTVVVSEDARRALRGAQAERLVDKGVVKLDKIDESIGIYELTAHASDAAPADIAHRKARQSRLIAIGAVVALAAGVALWLAWPMLAREASPRVAVFSLAAPDGDVALQQLAQGVGEDVANAISAMSVQTVARSETSAATRDERLRRARELDAQFAFDGAAERAGRNVRLTTAIVRVNDGVTVWSSTFDMPAAQIEGLRVRAAERSADVLSCGVSALRQRGAVLDSDVLALFLRACESTRDSPLEMRDALVQIVEREPRFTLARARLALSSAVASQDAPQPLRSQLLESARTEAQRALREDDRIGESYIALSLIEPERNWSARQALLRRALERDELNGTVNSFYADLLLSMGRVGEALAYDQRGLSLDPLSPSKQRGVAYSLLVTGDSEAARDIVERLAPAWPEHPRLWRARVRMALWSGHYDEVEALLNAPASAARTAGDKACWRHAVQALRAPTSQSAQRVSDCERAGRLPPEQAILLLAQLGDLDAAFAIATKEPQPDALFAPQAAPLRADPRFLLLMRDQGLLRYWNLSGDWPDFCRQPGLPYDCATEARRLL